MLVTENNSDFFSPLSGKNAKIIESSLISLYQKTYGDNFTSEEILDRKMVKGIISRILQEISWQAGFTQRLKMISWFIFGVPILQDKKLFLDQEFVNIEELK
ncbi:MAG TPA: hypothetical protein ENK86_05920 [Campylobacterales bacterium]|nr:hypothetical protein [Campylobacterales bacterium]